MSGFGINIGNRISNAGGGSKFGPATPSGLLIYRDYSQGVGAVKNLAAAGGVSVDGNSLVAPERGFALVNNWKPWQNFGPTITEGYTAGPTGAAGGGTRFITGASNQYLQQTVNLGSGPYDFSIWAWNSTGSSQTLQLARQENSVVSFQQFVIPADGVWHFCEWKFTVAALATMTNVYINNFNNLATDLSIAGARLEAGTSATTYNGGVADLVLTQAATGPATWGSGYVDMTGANASGGATTSDARFGSITQFAYYFVVRQTQAAGGYSTVVATPGYNNVFGMMAMDNSIERLLVKSNGATQCAARICTLRGNVDRVFGVIYDGANIYIDIDGTIIAKTAYTGGAIALYQLVYADTNAVRPSYLQYVYEVFYNNGSQFVNSTTLRKNLVKFLQNESDKRSRTRATGRTLWFAIGDSFAENTVGSPSATNWTAQMSIYLAASSLAENVAASGTTLTGSGGCVDQFNAIKAQYTASDYDHIVCVLVGGQNDFNTGTPSGVDTGYLTNLAALNASLKAWGVKWFLFSTALSRNVVNTANYDTLRASVKAGIVLGTHCDEMLADIPTMSPNNSYNVTPANYTVDGSHPSIVTGHTLMFNTWKTQIQNALSR